ncbi:MAG: alanine racemase [Clostridia bacterium]|nr:alanine racemase [Clostridia bacterium]
MSRIELVTDLRVIASNARRIRTRIEKNVKMLAIVKADAYGHGSAQVAKKLEEENLCDYFAVATAGEGVHLRNAGIRRKILILGYSDERDTYLAVQNDLIVTVYSIESLLKLNDVSIKLGKNVKAHLKIETGMNRIGVEAGDKLKELLSCWKRMPNIIMDGVFSHFSSADTNYEYTQMQFEKFKSACSVVCEYGFTPIRHIAASSAMFQREYQLDMVRAGILLYGGDDKREEFSPAQKLKTHPVRLISLKKGEKVGYGLNYTCPRDAIIMTVPCGYADGYPRLLGNRAYLLVNGRRAPVVGNICMDMLMADVTDAGEISLNSEVVLLGQQDGQRITPSELARHAETISYEIMLGFSNRVEKSWIE